MGFASESGYTPTSIESMMTTVMNAINTQFSITPPYTDETFLGTGFYKAFYSLIQRVQANEIKSSEIFSFVQQYFKITNEQISRPATTAPGILSALFNAGFIASVKPPADADAGKAFVCVDTDPDADDYADKKLQICNLLSTSIVGGVVTQGDQVETLVLTNGQSFDFKFSLPTITPTHIRLTLTLSANNQVVIASDDDIKAKLLANIQASYRLGKNFEPDRYFGVIDAPWASTVLLEWSETDESSYSNDVFEADFDELLGIDLSRIHLVEA